jgi:hypothetical protein
MGAKGAFAPLFFYLPLFENFTSVKIAFTLAFKMAFTHYLLWGLKNLPPLNFKLSPPLLESHYICG